MLGGSARRWAEVEKEVDVALQWKRAKIEKVCGLKGRDGKVKVKSTKEGGLKAAKGLILGGSWLIVQSDFPLSKVRP